MAAFKDLLDKKDMWKMPPFPEESETITFPYEYAGFKIKMAPPRENKPYKAAQMKYWSWRISKGMGLKMPVKLHIIAHDREETYAPEVFEQQGKPIYVPYTTLGQYQCVQSHWPRSYHHIIVRLRYSAKENLYVLAHELTHARQCEIDYDNDNVAFMHQYQVQQVLNNYSHNTFEKDARKTGVEWVEKILETGPLELVDPCGSVLVTKRKEVKRKPQRHDLLRKEPSRVFFGDSQEKRTNDALEKLYKEKMERSEYTHLPAPWWGQHDSQYGEKLQPSKGGNTFHFSFKWEDAKEVAKDSLSKRCYDGYAKSPSRNLRQPSEDHPYEASQFESAMLRVDGKRTKQSRTGKLSLDALLELSQSVGVRQHDGYGPLPGLRCNSP